ncbi:MAG: sugar nucleotide-binding protein, partial [Myxococcales bacterium]
WYGFARELAKLAGLDAGLLEPVATASLQSAARRPHDAVLENARLQALGLDRMPDWREGLQAYLAEELNR